MLPRSRSARIAGLALFLAAPLVAANAAPAFAAGESTTAVLTAPTSETAPANVFTWSYTFGGGTHELSNIAIGFCSTAILDDVASASAGDTPGVIFTGDVTGGHDGFGPGIKFDHPDSGTITVTFKNDHPISTGSFRIESHSGDGQNPDVTNTADGPGPCSTDQPGGDDDTDGDDDDDDGCSVALGRQSQANCPGGDDDTDGDDGDNNPGTTTANDPAPVVQGVTVEQPTNIAVAPTKTKTDVLGETFTAPAQLPRTGAGVQTLLTLALSLLAAGTVLRLAFSRRIRSASFPG